MHDSHDVTIQAAGRSVRSRRAHHLPTGGVGSAANHLCLTKDVTPITGQDSTLTEAGHDIRPCKPSQGQLGLPVVSLLL